MFTKKRACVFIIVMLLAFSFFAIYKSIDAGVTYSYMSQENEEQKREIKCLQGIALKLGKNSSKQEIMKAVKSEFNSKDYLIEERDGNLEIDNVVLVFDKDKLKSIKSFQEIEVRL